VATPETWPASLPGVPLGYKAFLVAVDREGCALYKEALDRYLPPDYSAVVYTSAHNDSELLRASHHASEFPRFGRLSLDALQDLLGRLNYLEARVELLPR
jgi:hypothetical protein